MQIFNYLLPYVHIQCLYTLYNLYYTIDYKYIKYILFIINDYTYDNNGCIEKYL